MAVETQAESALRVARASLAEGRYEDAIGPLLEALRALPDHPAILNDLGVAYLFTRRLGEAIDALRRSLATRPGSARTHFTLGLALAQSGDFDGALDSHRRAVALAPDLAEAYGRIGDLLVRAGRSSDAAAAYERARASAPQTEYGQLCGAKSASAAGDMARAESLLRALVARTKPNAETHLMLANLLGEARRMDEAADEYERSIALAPQQTTAYQGLVSSRRMTEADRPLLARMVARLGATDIANRQRMMLHFATGKAKDDLHDYAGAIVHFDAANAIRRKLAPFDRPSFEDRVARLIARFTKESLARDSERGADDEMPLLVLGMPRSGTTLIERILSSHPQIAGGGELAFWSEHGPSWALSDRALLADAEGEPCRSYLRILRSVAAGAARVTDKMPFNFQWIGLVHVLLPRARFVHCRRSPLDTCLSIYTTYFSRDWGFASHRADLAAYYRGYARLMDHWRNVLPPGAMLEVDYEQATAEPEDTARRLVAFSGLAWDPACVRPDRNADAVRTANKWEARQPVYRTSVERWRNYEQWLGELRELGG